MVNTQENIRKRIFQTINKIYTKQQSIDDILNFCQAFIYNAPYQSRIVFPSKPEDLNIIVTAISNKHNDQDIMGCYNEPEKALRINFSKKLVKNFSNSGFLLNLLVTLGHEYTHYLQYKAIWTSKENPIFKPAEKTQLMLDSLERNYCSSELRKLFLFKNKDLLKGKSKCAKTKLDQYLYMQLLYEENAQDCGYEYAREMLEALKADPLCDEQARKFLTKCEKKLAKIWEEWFDERDSKHYKEARVNYDKVIEELTQIDEEQIIGMADTPLRRQVIQNKLFAMRKAGVDKFEYFRTYCELVDFVPGTELSLNRESADYLIDCNQKELLKYYFKNCNMGDSAEIALLCDTNFIVKEDTPNFFTPEETLEICCEWAKQGKFYLIFNVLDGTYGSAEEFEFLDEAHCREVQKALIENKQLRTLVLNAYDKLLTLNDRKDTLDSEDLLFEAQNGIYVVELKNALAGTEETTADKALKKNLMDIYLSQLHPEEEQG